MSTTRRFIALRPAIFLPLAAALALAACNDKKEEAQESAQGDPALDGALGDQIMVDPDLVGQNRANQAAGVPNGDGSVPQIDLGPDAVAQARAAALTDVGGPGKMRKAPEAKQVAGALPPDATLSAAARAAAAPGGNGDCAAKAEYTTAWAAKLPAAFPVYPKGAVQEAAGTDTGTCALRVVNFVTPVPVGEVMDYYYTRASAAGFSAQRVLQDGDNVIGGIKGKASYVVYARSLPSGATEVDLITSGK
ncbi:conserved hypothetical protein [Altererythrobacter sp. B11]|uniref:hypothetical protein n=1 Tax=Altererythrobacter sp. B11 TaxID=2060312 RepID=UPI000DC6E9EA|nr:hypothetical protein [Altererythrobacter sp. B11]BBC72293.1 conserved hypothetical protein [Altererythrobacter sp. B11]